MARVDGQTIETRVGDAQELPFPDATFDVVVAAAEYLEVVALRR